MTLTVTDRNSANLLRSAVGMDVEVRDADGTVLGRFTPAPRPGMMFPEFGMTDEELERIENDPNARWYTADEVMARIRAIGGAG